MLSCRGQGPLRAGPASSEDALNYRHAFHAGNFADLFKHAALMRALELMQRARTPLLVVDTHAGTGRYCLPAEALATGEASAIRRLLADAAAPPVFDLLKQAVHPGVDVLVYPGSPALAVSRLRAADRLLACELRPDDGAELAALLRAHAPRAEARLTDGYAALAPALRVWPGPALVLVDPPFERGDDYARAVEAVGAALSVKPGATVLLWAPLKDLETLDALARAIERTTSAPGFVAELRLRPLINPLRLNGCALVVLNPPRSPAGEPELSDALEDAGGWIAEHLGERGGGLRLRHLATAKEGGAQGGRVRL